MARVEWTTLSGDDVETVVSMLLCSKMPGAQRVRPAQGDGGIDIFVAGTRGYQAERAVYQVKKFASNLTNSQKRKIKQSLNRVRDTSAAEGWKITEWYLVLPLDPTPGNLAWFSNLTDDVGFLCEWVGADKLGVLAANYPAIIDYYLRDGKERLAAAVESLAAIIAGRQGRSSGQPLVSSDVRSDLGAIYRAINEHDPHYRYEIAVSQSAPFVEQAQPPGPSNSLETSPPTSRWPPRSSLANPFPTPGKNSGLTSPRLPRLPSTMFSTSA